MNDARQEGFVQKKTATAHANFTGIDKDDRPVSDDESSWRQILSFLLNSSDHAPSYDQRYVRKTINTLRNSR